MTSYVTVLMGIIFQLNQLNSFLIMLLSFFIKKKQILTNRHGDSLGDLNRHGDSLGDLNRHGDSLGDLNGYTPCTIYYWPLTNKFLLIPYKFGYHSHISLA